jgi:hypothetical protein
MTTTLRSRVRPHLYRIVGSAGWLMIYTILGFMLLVVVIATSFFWIPYAFMLWFEEKPVLDGLQSWFVDDLLGTRHRGF